MNLNRARTICSQSFRHILKCLSSRWLGLIFPVIGAIASNMAIYRLYELSYQGGIEERTVWGMPAITWVDVLFQSAPYALMAGTLFFVKGIAAWIIFISAHVLCVLLILKYDMQIVDSKNGSDALLGSWVLQILIAAFFSTLVIFLSGFKKFI